MLADKLSMRKMFRREKNGKFTFFPITPKQAMDGIAVMLIQCGVVEMIVDLFCSGAELW